MEDLFDHQPKHAVASEVRKKPFMIHQVAASISDSDSASYEITLVVVVVRCDAAGVQASTELRVPVGSVDPSGVRCSGSRRVSFADADLCAPRGHAVRPRQSRRAVDRQSTQSLRPRTHQQRHHVPKGTLRYVTDPYARDTLSA